MDELEFVQRCVNGDRAALEEFLERYSRLIYNYIHSTLRLEGRVIADDVVAELFQELFCLLIKDNCYKLSTFKGKNGCSLASWLRQVAINFTIDYLRKNKTLVSLDEETEDGGDLKEVIPDDDISIRDLLSHKEKIVSLYECIEILELDEKYFLELHFNRGLKLEELRLLLNLSRGAIDMQKSRIIHKLRDCFRSKGFALDL
ncbi:MAG: sigma-70 family RNA polymerase sigma factor [Candidatus Omnitrophica bacterium]|nr:sigma-70 family RNA polymerase sigma factor [Candidatus Omnitrophota bacterium]